MIQSIAAIFALRVPQGKEHTAKALTHALSDSYGLPIKAHVNLSTIYYPGDQREPRYNQGLITLMGDGELNTLVTPARSTSYLGLFDGKCEIDPYVQNLLGIDSDNPLTLLSELRNGRHPPYDAKNYGHLVRERVHTKLIGHWASLQVVASPRPVLMLSANGRQLYACAYIVDGVVLILFSNFMQQNDGEDPDVKSMNISLRHNVARTDVANNSLFCLLQGKFLFTKVNTWCSGVAASPYDLCVTTERFINRNIL